MRRATLLAASFSVALMACTTPGHATSPTPSQNQVAQASTAAPGPAPLAIPSPTMPFLRCDTEDLEMQLGRVGVGLGNVGGLIEVRNKSSHDCDLYGYAGLLLLDVSGHPLSTKVIWTTSSYIFGVALVEAVVGLPAGTPPITPEHPVPGHAYIPVSWNDVQEPCSSAAQLRVTPPDASSSLVISAVPPATPGSIYVCSGGTLLVNPTRAAQAT